MGCVGYLIAISMASTLMYLGKGFIYLLLIGVAVYFLVKLINSNRFQSWLDIAEEMQEEAEQEEQEEEDKE